LIDNYIDETVLHLLAKRNPGVKATIFTGNISKFKVPQTPTLNLELPTLNLPVQSSRFREPQP
jgi:hypothetical protein